jgi:alpha-mannosidase
MTNRTADKTRLYYTFGNHMHWVDMEWLWGYDVLAGSVDDTLRYCAESGARGNINFDAAGYERLATEAPDAFARLRETVHEGTLEIVGGSYGQPYGLFHGGESNVRQRVNGVRTVTRLFGRRPRTFWEEEFDFFPQLPQMLNGVGITYASLFFQWTWHTPTIPEEEVPVVWWTGMDGSRLLAATKNRFSVHQWPEDFQEILADPRLERNGAALVQWLELMPSPDWMCRSELMLPVIRRLMDDPRFTVEPVTLREYLDTVSTDVPERRYTLDQVFHGMSLGKNGDLFRRLSRRGEATLLDAETAATLGSWFGRPYPHWDAYPVWELDEAWRELLLAQHHDNDECEGLCGHVGRMSYDRSRALAETVLDRSVHLLARRALGNASSAPEGTVLVFNPLGWRRTAAIEASSGYYLVPPLPAAGYRVLAPGSLERLPATEVVRGEGILGLRRRAGTSGGAGDGHTGPQAGVGIGVDEATGEIRWIETDGSRHAFPPGAWKLRRGRGKSAESMPSPSVEMDTSNGEPAILVSWLWEDGSLYCLMRPSADARSIVVELESKALPVLHPRYAGALAVSLAIDGEVVHDHPYGVSSIGLTGTHIKKYPTGDWMTAEQEYETIENPITALSFYDVAPAVGASHEPPRLQIIHDGSQAGFLTDGNLEIVLSMNDPWDEHYFVRELSARFSLRPHGPEARSALRRAADEFLRPAIPLTREEIRPPEPSSTFVPASQTRPYQIPERLEPVYVDSEHVCITAVFRESAWNDLFPNYAGREMQTPLVVRLVELDGVAHDVRLHVAGTVEAAAITNLLGEIEEGRPKPAVRVTNGSSELAFAVRAHEIATLYLDVAEARPIPRNLDEHRDTWAHAHRVEER